MKVEITIAEDGDGDGDDKENFRDERNGMGECGLVGSKEMED